MADTPIANPAEANRTDQSSSYIERLRKLYSVDRELTRISNSYQNDSMRYAMAQDPAERYNFSRLRALAETSENRVMNMAVNYVDDLQAVNRPRRARERAGIKCHFKDHNGWVRTETMDSLGETAPQTMVFPHMGRPSVGPVNLMGNGETTISRRSFALVKEAEIRDYKNNTTRKEAWFEEV